MKSSSPRASSRSPRYERLSRHCTGRRDDIVLVALQQKSAALSHLVLQDVGGAHNHIDDCPELLRLGSRASFSWLRTTVAAVRSTSSKAMLGPSSSM
eukprot:161412-Heterocapsa_arctica.AAC.1